MSSSLTPDERALVTEVLLERQRELLREISRTHRHQFREILKRNETLLESVLEKLREPVAV
jgi:hypothetical protein